MADLKNGLLLVAFASILYFSGYAYLDGYYEYYDISVREISPDIHEIIAHGAIFFFQIASKTGFVITLPLLSGLIIIGLIFEISNNFYFLLRRFIVFFGIFIIAIASISAHSLGLDQAKSDLSRLNPMQLSIFTEQNVIVNLPSPPNTQYKYLTSSPDTHFAVAIFQGGDRWWLVRFQKSDTVTLRVFQD